MNVFRLVELLREWRRGGGKRKTLRAKEGEVSKNLIARPTL
jgi:hypothetical protein